MQSSALNTGHSALTGTSWAASVPHYPSLDRLKQAFAAVKFISRHPHLCAAFSPRPSCAYSLQKVVNIDWEFYKAKLGPGITEVFEKSYKCKSTLAGLSCPGGV